jgi:hypothetical protein
LTKEELQLLKSISTMMWKRRKVIKDPKGKLKNFGRVAMMTNSLTLDFL